MALSHPQRAVSQTLGGGGGGGRMGDGDKGWNLCLTSMKRLRPFTRKSVFCDHDGQKSGDGFHPIRDQICGGSQLLENKDPNSDKRNVSQRTCSSGAPSAFPRVLNERQRSRLTWVVAAYRRGAALSVQISQLILRLEEKISTKSTTARVRRNAYV